jgi:ribosomal protein S18 acetylase RimI-like enzyme
VAEILGATGAFSADEIAVALELFDEANTAGSAKWGMRSDSGTTPSPFPLPAYAVAAPPTGSPDYVFLGAFTPEDELVGYACYGPTPGTDRTFDLYWIAVAPALQGAGIGTLLLREVERRLTGQNARLLVIETSSRSEYAPTRGFYARCGYAMAARVREFYAPGDDRIILTKRFQSDSPSGGERSRHE